MAAMIQYIVIKIVKKESIKSNILVMKTHFLLTSIFRARKKLIFASILCLVFMIGEIVGGILSNSLAIATDAAHLLTGLSFVWEF